MKNKKANMKFASPFFKKNKRGTDKLLSIYWFAILFIVAAGIVYMAALFYGSPYDVREIEATLLSNQIADCVSKGGYLNEQALQLTSDNFLEFCNLNFNVEDFKDWKTQEQFYVEINFYKFNKDAPDGLGSKFVEDIVAGNTNLKEYCDKKGKNFPVCVERDFYVLVKENPHIIKVKSIVRKTEKNV